MREKKKKNIKNNKELMDYAHLIILSLIRISLIMAIFGSIVAQRWTVLFSSLLVFALTFFPKAFEKRYKIDIPVEFEILTVLFIYASLFLGEVHGYYTYYWWWDLVLHTGSALTFGFIGFITLYILFKGNKVRAAPITIALFAFFFSLGIGALWEIFEFAMDQLFGLNMQKSGLIDTMWDLIADGIGALITSVAGFLYLKKNESFIFKKIVDRFIRDNPRIFKKK
jgi:hypothetical protein